MTPYLHCPAARERLEPFLDGELGVPEQVALESHLRWCRTCAARVEDMQRIGVSLRAAAATHSRQDDGASMAFVQSCVVARVRAERDGTLLVRLTEALGDRRRLWQAAGATAAVVICLIGTGAVLRAATLETPDSLAGVIERLANPGSDRNPVRLGGQILAPRGFDQGQIFASIPDEEIVLALAAVVTQEGRISNYQLLESTRAQVRRRQAAALTDDMDAVLDAVGRARFEPAQGLSGDPVAVNMVWLLTRTTVKSSVSVVQAAVLPVTGPPAILQPIDESPMPPLEFDIEPQTGIGGAVSTTA